MPNVAMVGRNIIGNRCLAKSPGALVTSDGVHSTICVWKITHLKSHHCKTEAKRVQMGRV